MDGLFLHVWGNKCFLWVVLLVLCHYVMFFPTKMLTIVGFAVWLPYTLYVNGYAYTVHLFKWCRDCT